NLEIIDTEILWSLQIQIAESINDNGSDNNIEDENSNSPTPDDSQPPNNSPIFLSEKEEGSGTRTFRGKTYTQEEWEAFEKQQWEKYKGKN
ncbi:MAG: hypothetical protein ACK5IC_07595, partial [Moheibacter sp.]